MAHGRSSELVILAGTLTAACSGTGSSERAPDPRPEPAAPPRAFTSADYDRHVEELRERLAGKGLGELAIRIEQPFVVVGNDPADVLAEQAQTVRWAADLLEQDFFDARPTRILDIYLFNDKASYRAGVRTLTGDDPSTPYGFYSSEHDGLFMNISTGGGTLVHELVHPYVEADFPDAPAWLNEGLGSLFEQSSSRDGKIIGLTNWRLAGLQEAIGEGPLPSFRELAAMTDGEFYDEDKGTNYAQARYLMYYLQEHDLLHGFYRAFRAARLDDPTGYQTLLTTLGQRDAGMPAFERRWADYVLELRFP